jgi:outer membrane protein assembly factor BamB
MTKKVINSKFTKGIIISILIILAVLLMFLAIRSNNNDGLNADDIMNENNKEEVRDYFGKEDLSHTIKLDKRRFDLIGFYNLKDPDRPFVTQGIDNRPLIQNDIVYITNHSNVLFAYDLKNENLLYEIPVTGTKGTLTNRINKLVYENKYYIFVNQQEEYDDKILYILDMETGEIVFERSCWSLDLDAFGINDNHLLFNEWGENFYVMNMDTLEIAFEDVNVASDELKSFKPPRKSSYIFESKLYIFDFEKNTIRF